MILELKQGSREWQEYRKEKFNASEIGAVMGVGLIKPYILAQYKYNSVEPYQNEAMTQGIKYEPKIRKIVEQEQGLSFKPCVMCLDDDPRFSASLDGFNAETNQILEIKFSKYEAEFIYQNEKPSDKYYFQVQQQLMVSGAKKAIFSVGYLDDEFNLKVRSIAVMPNPKIWEQIKKAWVDFENAYKNEIIDDEFLEISTELTELNDQMKNLKSRIDELKSRAISKANGKECKIANITIYKTIRKGDFDYKAFCKDSGICPSDDYKKDDSEIWGVRIN